MSNETHLLLHLGYPKSGTTTLQAGVFPACSEIFFAGKSGETGRETITPEANRFRTLINYGSQYQLERQAPEVLAELRQIWQASGKDRMLMSLEGLTNPFVDTNYVQPRDIYRKATDIAQMLAPFRDNGTQIRVLTTLRPQAKLLPSLFSQIYMHGFATGLYKPSYDGFLDFMLDDPLTGFGPDFAFDSYHDHLGSLFGGENIYAAQMSKTGPAARAVSAFLGIDETTCLKLLEQAPIKNVRDLGNGRRMMPKSGGVDSFEEKTGIALRRKAFRLRDRLRLRRGKPVIWQLPDRTERINSYYAASNARLAETYGITL